MFKFRFQLGWNPYSDVKDRDAGDVRRLTNPGAPPESFLSRRSSGDKYRKTATDSWGSVRKYTHRRGNYPRRSLVVLRKEVIQPQVLLRLPCYDLVPIIELTFGAFFPCGLDRRLRVLPTFVA